MCEFARRQLGRYLLTNKYFLIFWILFFGFCFVNVAHVMLGHKRQNQHISNKQRNAMRRMEKEAPPATITKPLPEATAASGSGESDAVPDLGSLRI